MTQHLPGPCQGTSCGAVHVPGEKTCLHSRDASSCDTVSGGPNSPSTFLSYTDSSVRVAFAYSQPCIDVVLTDSVRVIDVIESSELVSREHVNQVDR
jgi:hypothetical protein